MKKNFLLTIKSIPTMALIFLFLSFLGSTKVQAQITISQWEMNLGEGPQQVPPPALDFYGAPRGYYYKNIPAIIDANWVPAPLDGSGKVAFSVPSQLVGIYGCLTSIDFTYFQISIYIPAGTQINQFTVSFDRVDDGARIYIFNSAYPNGAFVDGADVTYQCCGALPYQVTTNLASLAVAGEVNRIVVVQYDCCKTENNLLGVQINVNGKPIPVVETNNCPIGVIPSCSVSAMPSNNTYTGGVPTNIYIGYGPQSVALNVTATGGSGFRYRWVQATGLSCTTCASPTFTPTAAGTFTFTVYVTNNCGFITTCSITICVLDIRDGNDGKKVFVCHVPPGNPANPQTISISVNAVPAHIPGHTLDHLGKCGESPCGTPSSADAKKPESNDMLTDELKISVSPNPNNGQFTVKLNNLQSSKAEVTILNANGSIIEKRNVQNNMKGNPIQFNLRTKASGILLIKVVSEDGVSTERIVIQR